MLLLCDAPHRQRRLEHGRALPRAVARCTRPPRGAASRRCRSCRCSTRTTRCGSASSWRARCWSGSSAYWKERLAGAPALLELPTDRPRPPVQSHRGAREPVRPAPRAARRGCRRWGGARAPRCTWCCWPPSRCCCRRYSGQRGRGRGQPRSPGARGAEVEGLIGFFVNTLVLRTDLSGDPTFRELLGRVREATLGAYEHQEVPFERLVAELQPGALPEPHAALPGDVHRSRTPTAPAWRGLAGLRMERGRARRSETAQFDLSLTRRPARRRPARRAGVQHRPLRPRHRPADARPPGSGCWSRSPRTRTCGSRGWRCSGRGGARAWCVEAWNRTEAAYPRDACIHELFEAQAARTPGAVALVCGEESAHLRGAERAREPAGAPPRRPRRGARGARGRSAWSAASEMVVAILAVAQGGRRLRAAGPGLSRASGWRSCSPTAAARVLLTQERCARRFPAATTSRSWRRRGRRRGSRRSRRDARRAARTARTPGVRDLHLGLARGRPRG